MRVTLDTESGLIRQVASHEWWPDLRSHVHVVESWSDYRNIGGLRAPFLRISVIDDGDNTVTTTWTAVQAG